MPRQVNWRSRWWPKPATWAFIGTNVGVGALQAVGGLILYGLVIYITLKHLVRFDAIQRAVTLRTAPIMEAGGWGGSGYGDDAADRAAPI